MAIKESAYIKFILLSGFPYLTSCMSELPDNHDTDKINKLTVNASLLPMTSSRASVDELNYDGWSYRYFETGDFMGFYSEHGDYFTDNGNGAIINLPLEFIGNNQFRNKDNFVFSPSKMSVDGIFMYYPYDEDMSGDIEGNGSEPGMELRIENEGVLKCVDLLDNASLDVAALASGVITGTFRHAFSELIIMRGEGFNNPPEGKDGIWVVMQNAYTHIRVYYNDNPSWSCYPELIYDPNYVPQGVNAADFDAHRWQAWQGGNYSITMEDEGVPAWYVLLPCIGEYNTDYTVQAIELYDNDGNLQKITSMKLSESRNDKSKYTKILKQSWRYPLVVEMKELVPTINPYPITPWEGDTDLTNERKRGITNAFEFKNWLNYYLTYLSDGEYENLLQYGDRIVDSSGNTLYWHFYLLNDIDLSEMFREDGDVTTESYLIPRLTDIIDGVNMNEMEGNIRPNFTISGLTKTFVGTMSGYGCLQNIDFYQPNIITESTSPAGILVNNMTPPLPASGSNISGGLIENCNIEFGTLMSKGYVGAIAGSIQDATVRNCSASGMISGSQTLSGSPFNSLIGTQTGANTIENNESNVIFTSIQD